MWGTLKTRSIRIVFVTVNVSKMLCMPSSVMMTPSKLPKAVTDNCCGMHRKIDEKYVFRFNALRTVGD